jgi:hypothetical protein
METSSNNNPWSRGNPLASAADEIHAHRLRCMADGEAAYRDEAAERAMDGDVHALRYDIDARLVGTPLIRPVRAGPVVVVVVAAAGTN